MQSTPIVLEHAYKHGLSKRDIIHAWKNAYIERRRDGRYALNVSLLGRIVREEPFSWSKLGTNEETGS